MTSAYDKITLLDKWLLAQKLISDPELSRCAVACGFHLIDLYHTHLHRAWPSYDTLAKKTGANRRTVIKAVKRLLDSGYFEVERGSGRRSNYYRPNFSLTKSAPVQSTNGDQNTTTPREPRKNALRLAAACVTFSSWLDTHTWQQPRDISRVTARPRDGWFR